VLLAAMTIILVPLVVGATAAEQGGTRYWPRPVPIRRPRRCSPAATWRQGGALWHRQLAIWATATTAASNGSVNAMHDSFTPLGGLIPMWLIQFGEVVFGGSAPASTACWCSP
jgi:K+-transporting ATPase ATPase A chain